MFTDSTACKNAFWAKADRTELFLSLWPVGRACAFFTLPFLHLKMGMVIIVFISQASRKVRHAKSPWKTKQKEGLGY